MFKGVKQGFPEANQINFHNLKLNLQRVGGWGWGCETVRV